MILRGDDRLRAMKISRREAMDRARPRGRVGRGGTETHTAASYGHVPERLGRRYLQLSHTTTALRARGLYTFIATHGGRGCSRSDRGPHGEPAGSHWRSARCAAYRPARRLTPPARAPPTHTTQSSSVTASEENRTNQSV